MTQNLAMLKKLVLSCGFALACITAGQAQYTETINSNRPGTSQGAFAVGRGVLQFEGGLRFGQNDHSLLNYKSDRYGLDYTARYGAFVEELEFQITGSFVHTSKTQTVGGQSRESSFSNFESNFIGAKYLLYDPYKERKFDDPNIRSWHANHAFKWETLIPAISVYGGFNIVADDNPYISSKNGNFSPQLGVSTQNNWGRWVFVMNFIADQITETDRSFSGIFTLTRALNREYSVFAEFQAIKSDYYSDDILRVGGARLFSDNFQVDVYGLTNFKNTPQRWEVGVGVSYRIDMHDVDVILRADDKKKEKEEEEDKKKKRDEMLKGNGDDSN